MCKHRTWYFEEENQNSEKKKYSKEKIATPEKKKTFGEKREIFRRDWFKSETVNMFDNNSCSSILNVGAPAAQDNSIVKKDYYTYTPYTNSLDESEEIRIAIQNPCLLPSESYLYMQVTVKTEQCNKDTKDDKKLKFVNNFPSFLFTDARYELNGVEIDRIRNVGITSTMKIRSASCPSNTLGYFHYTASMGQKVAESENVNVYDIMLPLSVWFGFCDDYRKVILNSRHELILNRARNSLNCIRSDNDKDPTNTEVKVSLTKLEWKMPHITLADNLRNNLTNFLGKNKMLPIQFRSWDLYEYPELTQTTDHLWAIKTVSHLHKPRYVIVAFQNDRKDKKNQDVSKFDSLHINSVRLHMNSNVYPYHMHEVNIAQGRCLELYEAYTKIQTSYYNGMEPMNLFNSSLKEFQTDVLFTFDVSRADESLNNGSIDVRLEFKSDNNLPAKTSAFCLIIYENSFDYSPSDGLVVKQV